jgi:hypothetical protein
MTAMPLARKAVLAWLALVATAQFLLEARAFAAPPATAAQAEFQRLNPCPANDAREGGCPGYVIDYVVPLCMGGPDVAYNMRWQTQAEAKAREAVATRRCPVSPRDGQVHT